jgi:hypothetical protein
LLNPVWIEKDSKGFSQLLCFSGKRNGMEMGGNEEGNEILDFESTMAAWAEDARQQSCVSIGLSDSELCDEVDQPLSLARSSSYAVLSQLSDNLSVPQENKPSFDTGQGVKRKYEEESKEEENPGAPQDAPQDAPQSPVSFKPFVLFDQPGSVVLNRDCASSSAGRSLQLDEMHQRLQTHHGKARQRLASNHQTHLTQVKELFRQERIDLNAKLLDTHTAMHAHLKKLQEQERLAQESVHMFQRQQQRRGHAPACASAGSRSAVESNIEHCCLPKDTKRQGTEAREMVALAVDAVDAASHYSQTVGGVSGKRSEVSMENAFGICSSSAMLVPGPPSMHSTSSKSSSSSSSSSFCSEPLSASSSSSCVSMCI